MGKLIKNLETVLLNKTIDLNMDKDYPLTLIYDSTISYKKIVNLPLNNYLNDFSYLITDTCNESYSSQILSFLLEENLLGLINKEVIINITKKDLLGLKDTFIVNYNSYMVLKEDKFFKPIKSKSNNSEVYDYLQFVGYYGNCRILLSRALNNDKLIMLRSPESGLIYFSILNIINLYNEKAKVLLNIKNKNTELYNLMIS